MDFLKKPFPQVLMVLCGVIAGVIIASALFVATGFSIFGKIHNEPKTPVDSDNSELITLAYRVLGYIKDGDFDALSKTVHPEFGVVFSPRATVTLSTNRYFQAEQVALFGTDTNMYVWGVLSGSGDPIEMTPKDYFAKFVFDKDYTAAPIIGVNHIVRSGNALENITDVFPNVKYVDFHVTGSGKDSAGDLAWSSLRLGFEEYEGNLWLTVIIHSEWTE